jgi:hypothetical protein
MSKATIKLFNLVCFTSTYIQSLIRRTKKSETSTKYAQDLMRIIIYKLYYFTIFTILEIESGVGTNHLLQFKQEEDTHLFIHKHQK